MRLYWASCNASSKNVSLILFSELCHLPVLHLMHQNFSFLIIFYLIVPGTIFLFSPWVHDFVCGTKYLGLYLLPVLKITLFLAYDRCHPLRWYAANLISVFLFFFKSLSFICIHIHICIIKIYIYLSLRVNPWEKNLLVTTTASFFLFVFDLLTLAFFLIYLRILTLFLFCPTKLVISYITSQCCFLIAG